MPITAIPLPFEGLASVLDGLSVPKNKGTDIRNMRLERDHLERGPGGTQLAPAPVLTSGLGFRVGSFARQSGLGAQVVTHTLNATPVALILWTNSVNDFGPPEKNIRYSMGATDGAVVGAVRGSRSVAISARDETLPTSTYRRKARKLLTVLSRDNGTTIAECDWTSWTSTSFTIDWTVNNGDPDLIFYMIIGGTGMTATLTAWDATATGNVAVNHNLGTTPVVAITFGSGLGTDDTDATDDNAILSFGASDSAGNQFAMALASFDNVNVSDRPNWRVFESAHTITGFDVLGAILSDALPTRAYRASHVSFSSTQFTYNFSILNSATRFFTLCIAGISGEVDVQTLPNANAPLARVYLTDFVPQGILFATTRSTTRATGDPINDAVRWSIGATDTNQERVAAIDSKLGYLRKHSHRQVMAIDIPGRTQEETIQALRADFGGLGFSGDTENSYALLYQRNLTSMEGNPPTDSVGGSSPAIDQPDLEFKFASIPMRYTGITDGGMPRNLFHLKLTNEGEKYVMLTDTKAFVYSPSTGLFTDSGESYGLNERRRFSIASINNLMVYSSRDLTVGGVPTIRTYDGTTFGNLITVGQNHAANIVLAFNDRIVTGDVRYDPGSGVQSFNTQIRWSKNGQYNKWTGLGSGSLLIEETSNEPLVTGFVLGDRCFLAKRHEIIDLIATGTLSPVFRQESRSQGVGVLCRHSVATAESVAFFVGPDDIYMWDGNSFRPIGADIYKTLRAQINYNRLNDVQGLVYTPESLYVVITGYNEGGNFWAYDYRRDRWFRDSFQDIRALGLFDVGTQFTTDIDASSFIVIANSDRTTWRLDDTVLTYRSKPMDSYVATKDFPSQVVSMTDEGQALIPTLARMTVLKRVFVLVGDNTDPFDVSVSTDEGATWLTTRATPNAYKLAVAHFSDGVPFMSIRFRFRSISDDDFIVRAAAYEWEEGGEIVAADTPETAILTDLEQL